MNRNGNERSLAGTSVVKAALKESGVCVQTGLRGMPAEAIEIDGVKLVGWAPGWWEGAAAEVQ